MTGLGLWLAENGGESKNRLERAQGDLGNDRNVTLIMMMVSQVHAYVKTHSIIYTF